jgi:hypothetical protein
MPLRVIESKERLFVALLKRASLAVLFGDLENKIMAIRLGSTQVIVK